MSDDVGTTKRKAMTPARRLRIYEANGGICVTCGLKIKSGDKWFVEHKIALALGAPDTDDNCAPAHYACKAEKDADDFAKIAKAKRIKKKALNITSHKPKIHSQGFPKSEKSISRQPKTSLAPRALFK